MILRAIILTLLIPHLATGTETGGSTSCYSSSEISMMINNKKSQMVKAYVRWPSNPGPLKEFVITDKKDYLASSGLTCSQGTPYQCAFDDDSGKASFLFSGSNRLTVRTLGDLKLFTYPDSVDDTLNIGVKAGSSRHSIDLNKTDCTKIPARNKEPKMKEPKAQVPIPEPRPEYPPKVDSRNQAEPPATR